jgi:hypothetical protein
VLARWNAPPGLEARSGLQGVWFETAIARATEELIEQLLKLVGFLLSEDPYLTGQASYS